MTRAVVRYQLKADRVAEHEALLRDVFAELASVRPAGLTYRAMKLEDGVSFLHIATVAGSGRNPLASLPAFKAFTARIGDRCVVKPESLPATAIGSYAAEG